MNCLLTNEKTNMKTKGRFPVSREGRELLPKVIEAHNQRLREAFIEAHSGKGMTEDMLSKIAPKISIKYALGLLEKQEPDMMETLEQVLNQKE